MTTTSNKRKRSDLESPASIPNETEKTADTYERSEDFYFDDGNVVLVAEKTAFRVHRGQMARHSPVFRDMFGTVQQPNDSERFDGCSVVKLSDRSIDVKRLLSALYDVKPLASQKFNMLCGVLCMADKYLMDDLRQYSCEALALAYPSSLAQWDSYEEIRPSARSMISVARKAGAEILLPSALYHLVSTSSSAELVTLGSAMNKLDHSMVHKGKEAVLSLWTDFLQSETSVAHCENTDCAGQWQELLDELFKEALEPKYVKMPPLHNFQEFWDFADQDTEMCEECRDYIKTEVEKRRSKIWDDLPGIFGLPCWDDLAKK